MLHVLMCCSRCAACHSVDAQDHHAVALGSTALSISCCRPGAQQQLGAPRLAGPLQQALEGCSQAPARAGPPAAQRHQVSLS